MTHHNSIVIAAIACVAHEANRAYCASLGDTSQVPWAEAPEWQKRSALAGVEMHLANPEATPEQSHESWLAAKLADGWKYGTEKDAEKKEHPCCVPYAELAPEQKAKDWIFRGVVHAMKDLPTARPLAEHATARPLAEPAAPGLVPIRYIGSRDYYKDRLYGSNLSFVPFQTRAVPPDLARNFLRHPDVFERGAIQVAQHVAATDDTAEVLAHAQQEQAEKTSQYETLQDMRDAVMTMEKDSLAEFATREFQQKIDKRQAIDKLRQEVLGFIDRFGTT